MRPIFILFFTLLSSVIHSQTILKQDKVDYFAEGVKAINNNDFIAADSLFLKAYNLNPEKNALLNLALTKIWLNEICEGCKLLNHGEYRYDEPDFNKLFNELCIKKIDTIYLDKKNNVLQSYDGYTFLVEEIYSNCDFGVIGKIHKKGHSASYIKDFGTLSTGKSDIYATYIIQDSIKIYNHIYRSTFHSDNEIILADFKERFEKYIKNKYDFSNVPHIHAYIALDFVIDLTGKVINYDIDEFPYDYMDKEITSEIILDIEKAILNINVLKPEIFVKENVASQHSILIGI